MPRDALRRNLAGAAAWRWLLLAAAVAALVLAFALSGSSEATVANVNGKPITVSTFNRWLQAAAASIHASDSQLPGFVPDAPGYRRCIAYERRAAAKTVAGLSDAKIRSACSAYRTTLAQSAIEFLISGGWVLDQGAREHVVVTEAQIQAQLHQSFKNSSGLVHLLSSSHLSRSDLEYEARISLVSSRLDARHAGPAPTITTAQITSYYNSNRSSFGNATLAQATPVIRQLLVAQAQAPAINAYLTRVQSYFRPRTSCARGYRIGTYCRAG